MNGDRDERWARLYDQGENHLRNLWRYLRRRHQRYVERAHRGMDRQAKALEIPTTWQEAELAAANWMRKHGYPDARCTPPGVDDGIDITSRAAIGQVKHHQTPIGIQELQRHYGIATAAGKQALFFALSGYTPRALKWARAHGVECYQYPPFRRVV